MEENTEEIKTVNAENDINANNLNVNNINANDVNINDVKKKKRISKGALIGIIAGAAAVIAAVIVIGIFSGAFLSRQEKIAMAAYKTLKSDTIGSSLLNACDVLSSDAVSGDVSFKLNDFYFGSVKIEGSVSSDIPNADFYADGSISYMGLDESMELSYNDSSIRLKVPELTGDTVYEYDYTKANDEGYLADYISSNTNATVEDLNNIFKGATALSRQSSKYNSVLASKLMKVFKKISVTSAGSADFEIDGKACSCKGYTIKLTSDDLASLLEAVQDARTEVYGDTYDELEKSLSAFGIEESMSFSDAYDEIISSPDPEAECDIDVYLYKGMLAAVCAQEDDYKITLLFEGGSSRSSNIELVTEGSYETQSFKRESSVVNGKETGEISLNGDTVEYSYDTQSGDFTISSGSDLISGTCLLKDGSIVIQYKDSDISFAADLKKGAASKSIKGEALDVGAMTEDDIDDIISDLRRAFLSFL